MKRVIELIVVEGNLEVPASLRLLQSFGLQETLPQPINKGGRNAFWADVARYNQAALRLPGVIFGLADLESDPCPSGLITKHLRHPRHHHFILRVAERMLESWLLADPAIARFLKISVNALPINPDREENPKRTLVNLARQSTSRSIQNDLVPELGSSGVVGKGYTPRMTEFIEEHWNPFRAEKRSESLRRARASLLNKLVG